MIRLRLPAAWFLCARLAWRHRFGRFDVSMGVEAFNLLGFRFREMGGVSFPNRPDLGGERLGRRVTVFMEARI
jgi:hypothetical protein